MVVDDGYTAGYGDGIKHLIGLVYGQVADRWKADLMVVFDCKICWQSPIVALMEFGYGNFQNKSQRVLRILLQLP